jgi:HEAT repeat protein
VRIGAAVVLGKLGDPRAIEPLEALSADPFSEVRDTVKDALERLRKKRGKSR